MNRLRSALWLPLFDDLADPRVVAGLAADAEEAGWDGCFVWDHLFWRAPVRQVADPWITLAAIATATERLRLGPMVTALARAGRPRSPARPRRWTGSATAGSPSASGSAATGSAASCPRPASSSTTGGADRCSTSPWRSWPPPGRASPCAITASTTPSTTSRSCRGRYSGPACRCGPPDSPEPQADPPGRPARRLLPGQSRAPRSARRGRRHPHRTARWRYGAYDIAVSLAPGVDPAPYASAARPGGCRSSTRAHARYGARRPARWPGGVGTRPRCPPRLGVHSLPFSDGAVASPVSTAATVAGRRLDRSEE